MISKKKILLTLAAMCVVGLVSRAAYALWQPNTTIGAQYVEFDTILEVRVAQSSGSYGPTIMLRGVSSGTTVPTEWWAFGGVIMIEACHRNALLMMNRPGRFLLRGGDEAAFVGGPRATSCTLVARAP